MTVALPIANALAALAIAAFVLLYATVRWERTPEGRNAMAVSVAVLALALAGLTRRALGSSADLVVLLVYAGVAAAFVWRILIFCRAQHAPRHRKERGEHRDTNPPTDPQETP